VSQLRYSLGWQAGIPLPVAPPLPPPLPELSRLDDQIGEVVGLIETCGNEDEEEKEEDNGEEVDDTVDLGANPFSGDTY
jgi:hypothetical protein